MEMNRIVSLERRRALHRQSSQFVQTQHQPKPSIVIPLRDRHQRQRNSPSPGPVRSPRMSQLSWLHRSLAAMTLLLTGGTLAVYGGTVYSQQRWHEATQELEQLRQQERELVIATEALRRNILTLDDYDPGSNLVSVSEQLLYVEPAPPRDRQPPADAGHSSLETTPMEFPLGY